MKRFEIRRKNLLYSLSGVWLLIALTSIFSVLSFIIWQIYPDSIGFFALQPSAILEGRNLWTLVTHIFVHGGIFHLLINMFVLFSLGGLSERIIGKRRFLSVYLGAGVFAGFLSVLLAGLFGYGFWERVFGNPDIYMVGASGAIFAIAGLFVVLLPKLRFSIIFLPFFTLPAYIMVPLVLFLTWLATVAVDLPIGNIAHLGGFIFGLVYGFYLRAKYRRKVEMLGRMFK